MSDQGRVTRESAQELLYVPHNASYNFGQELKTSDVSDLSHFNAFSIATTPPGAPKLWNQPFNPHSTTASHSVVTKPIARLHSAVIRNTG